MKVEKHTAETCGVCAERERLIRAGKTDESLIQRCKRDGTDRFVWYGRTPKTPHEANKLVKVFLEAFEITKPRGRKKALNLLEIERAIYELPATATIQIVADRLEVSKKTLERYLGEWGEPFHDMQARIKGKPKPSRLRDKLKKGKTKKKKMF